MIMNVKTQKDPTHAAAGKDLFCNMELNVKKVRIAVCSQHNNYS